MDFAALVRSYGYAVIILGTMLQGEVVLLIAGFLAHQGYLSLWLVWLVATLSAMAGDLTYFEVGRRWGDRALRKLPSRLTKAAGSVRQMISRNPNKIMLSMRFLFGMRILMPILCGTAEIRLRHFLLMNAITAMLWAALFTGVGYLFGLAARPFIHDIEAAEPLVILVIIGIVVPYHWLSARFRSRHSDSDR